VWMKERSSLPCPLFRWLVPLRTSPFDAEVLIFLFPNHALLPFWKFFSFSQKAARCGPLNSRGDFLKFGFLAFSRFSFRFYSLSLALSGRTFNAPPPFSSPAKTPLLVPLFEDRPRPLARFFCDPCSSSPVSSNPGKSSSTRVAAQFVQFQCVELIFFATRFPIYFFPVEPPLSPLIGEHRARICAEAAPERRAAGEPTIDLTAAPPSPNTSIGSRQRSQLLHERRSIFFLFSDFLLTCNFPIFFGRPPGEHSLFVDTPKP